MFSDLEASDEVHRDDGLDDYLNFGKYKRKKIRSIMREDPQYIDWACEEGIIALDDEAADWFEQLITICEEQIVINHVKQRLM